MDDEIIITVYRRMVTQVRCSAEDILEDPELRNTFLTESRQALSNDLLPERTLLHRLSYLRKQRRLPRSRDIAAAG